MKWKSGCWRENSICEWIKVFHQQYLAMQFKKHNSVPSGASAIQTTCTLAGIWDSIMVHLLHSNPPEMITVSAAACWKHNLLAGTLTWIHIILQSDLDNVASHYDSLHGVLTGIKSDLMRCGLGGNGGVHVHRSSVSRWCQHISCSLHSCNMHVILKEHDF